MYIEKYQATGNDFIMFKSAPKDPNLMAKAVCDRHFGVGADGILYPSKSELADIKMNYYNADGSLAKMCGNGIRAFARFVYEHGMVEKEAFVVETLAGLKSVQILDKDVVVNIGKANLNVGKTDINQALDAKTPYDFSGYKGYVLSTGTLHTVLYLDNVKPFDIKDVGSIVQNDPLFTDQTNVNFVKVLDHKTLKVETFERGAGWTLSCGTGVSASVYHAHLMGYLKSKTTLVHVPGGKLKVEIKQDEIYLEGPAVKVMEGVFYEKN